MEPRTTFSDVMAGDEPATGTVLKSVSPNVTEALGYTPLDFLFVDRQHGSPVAETLENLVRVGDLVELPLIVRVPRDDMSLITYFLDMGVSGIVIPQVTDPETVVEASSHVRYQDGRSLGSYSRAARFGEVPKDRYAAHVNENLALIPMIETVAGMEQAAAIAARPETSAIAIGPGDLAWDLGYEFGSDPHRDAIDEVIETVTGEGCPVGIFVGTESALERYRGPAAFVIYSSDVTILMDAYKEIVGE